MYIIFITYINNYFIKNIKLKFNELILIKVIFKLYLKYIKIKYNLNYN